MSYNSSFWNQFHGIIYEIFYEEHEAIFVLTIILLHHVSIDLRYSWDSRSSLKPRNLESLDLLVTSMGIDIGLTGYSCYVCDQLSLYSVINYGEINFMTHFRIGHFFKDQLQNTFDLNLNFFVYLLIQLS